MDVEDKHATQTSIPIPPTTDEVDNIIQDTVLLIYILQLI